MTFFRKPLPILLARLGLGGALAAIPALDAQTPEPGQLVTLQSSGGTEAGGWMLFEYDSFKEIRGPAFKVPEGKVLVISKVVAHLEARGVLINWLLVATLPRRGPSGETIWRVAGNAVPTPRGLPGKPRDVGTLTVCDQVSLGYGVALPPGTELRARASAPPVRGDPPVLTLKCLGYLRPLSGP